MRNGQEVATTACRVVKNQVHSEQATYWLVIITCAFLSLQRLLYSDSMNRLANHIHAVGRIEKGNINFGHEWARTTHISIRIYRVLTSQSLVSLTHSLSIAAVGTNSARDQSKKRPRFVDNVYYHWRARTLSKKNCNCLMGPTHTQIS